MHCENCGKKISEESKFCRFCGWNMGLEGKSSSGRLNNSSYFQRLFNGRLNRRNYLMGRLLSYILIIVVAIFGALLGILYIVGLAGLIMYSISLGVRRLHDLSKSGWYLVLEIIPIVNIVLGIYMLFGAGESKTNKYGNVPYPKVDFNIIVGKE